VRTGLWKRHVVVEDTTFHAGGPRRAKPGQLERYRSMLHDEPKKLAFRMTHVPAAPMTIFNHEEVPNVKAGSCSSPGAERIHSQQFKSALPKEKCAIHKPGLDQSWYGSMHDAHLQD
jgi:hypothetical protein